MIQRAGAQWVVASNLMRSVRTRCQKLGATDVSVVVYGPSGAGKEHVARSIHENSTRRDRAFVAVNAGAIAAGVAESALFGHERGAFTGAVRGQTGYFEKANEGTLFLDEIGELPLVLQAKLLRVLDTGTFLRVGGVDIRRTDVRMICATHRDLRALVRSGKFREDLYFRIAGARIDVPPLCLRVADVEPLATYFGTRFSGGRDCSFSSEALDVLRLHSWPGNVRELASVVRLALVHAEEEVVYGHDVRRAIGEISMDDSLPLENPLDDALRRSRGNVSAAARRLGIPRSTLRDRLAKRYQIAPEA